jgi:hypothetical protein
MIHALVLAALSECTTYIHDPQPPTNLRDAPQGKVLTTLTDGIALYVDADRDGWLHVTSPAAGWVHESVTTVRCGSGWHEAILALGERAKTSRAAADLLVRLALVADGGPGESAAGAITDLMLANPKLLIAVLDQFNREQRRDVLSVALELDPDQRDATRAFDRAIAAAPDSPTAATWHALPATLRSW